MVSDRPGLYLEELEVGRRYGAGTVTVTLEDIQRFAREFDPQPFHLDEEAAGNSVFGGLVASGWHTAAITMRLRVQGELQLAGGWIGLGVESLRWPNAVHPGDTLTAVTEVLEKRESKSRPDRGIIRVRTSTLNQAGDIVFETVSVQIALRRNA